MEMEMEMNGTERKKEGMMKGSIMIELIVENIEQV
jgi:hypothetical protein